MTQLEVKQEFARCGVSLAEWARLHGFPKHTVYDLLSGKNKGSRGEAFRIAVALGLRHAPCPAGSISGLEDLVGGKPATSQGERQM